MSPIISKFEAKSSRVKGLAFHPTLPWVLAAHHNGSIQIYDYRMGSVVEKFEDNSGPVRSCAFHPTQPLLVTAGDDTILRVYNYRQRKLLFTMTGHMDFVRSVSFHHEAPWIVSASDDQTIRIWNWQSRTCVATLSGHNHYVMCAAFHPGTEDLLVSASLDQTIRVWDISNIRARYAPSPQSHSNGSLQNAGSIRSSSGGSINSGSGAQQIDLFAGSGLDTSVKFIMEGHDRGVNWVAFHPTKPVIASASDDRTVKLWRYNDVRAWEVESYRGHTGNVSAVLWHPRADVVISDAEDRTLRFWDCSAITGTGGTGRARSSAFASIKRDSDRFWCLAAHPHLNVFGAGHDNGFIIFKMDRERPAYSLVESVEGDELFFVKDKLLRSFKLDSSADSDVFVSPVFSDATSAASWKLPATVSFSPTERAVMISSNHASSNAIISIIQLKDKSNPLSCSGSFAQFVGRNRFVSLESSHNSDGAVIVLRAMNDLSTAKPLPVPSSGIARLLPGPTGTFLAASSSKIFSMDGNSGRVLGSIDAAGIKYASWSANFSNLALMGRKSIHIVDVQNGTLGDKVKLAHTDTSGIKSGVWDLSCSIGPIFYYTTPFHLKYLLPSGDFGIICTISSPLYLIRVKNDLVHALDRSGAVLLLAIDPTECHFKLALSSGNPSEIYNVISNSNLVGQAIIAFLREKGHAATALQFVKDPSSRFELAIECLQLDEAVAAAEALNDASIWSRLGEEALLMGNVDVSLNAFKRAGNQSRLAFVEMITGTEPTPVEGNDNLTMLQALWRSDVGAACEQFEKQDLPVLSALMKATHLGEGISHDGCDLGDFLSRNKHKAQISGRDYGNWPLLFDPVTRRASALSSKPEKGANAVAPAKSGWAELQLDGMDFGEEEEIKDADRAFFGNNLDIELDDLDVDAFAGSAMQSGAAALIDLELPADLPPAIAACENQLSAMKANLCSARNLSCISPLLESELKRMSLAGQFYLPSVMHIGRSLMLRLPAIGCHLAEFQDRYLDVAMSVTTQGRFSEAISHFREFLQLSALLEPNEAVADAILQAREYVLGLSLEVRRRALAESEAMEALELACLFTRCQLKGEHLLLALRAALALAYKLGCHKTSAHVARRIIALQPAEAIQLQARKVLAVAERANYAEALPVGCRLEPEASSKSAVDMVHAVLVCPDAEGVACCGFCGAAYAMPIDLQACAVCEMGNVRC